MMKKLFFFAIGYFIAVSSYSQLRIFSFEAKLHVGDTVQVDGITVFTQHDTKEKATYVYYGHKPPKQELTVMIPDADLRNFEGPINKLFNQKFATVIGKVVSIKKQPVIVAHNLKDFAPGPAQ